MIKNYIAFDLETTGLDIEKDSIIEIGALKVIDGKVSDRFMEFVRPPMGIPKHITEITGITNEMVCNARDIRDVIVDFVAFCEDFVLVGHNILFDYKFTKRYANLSGLSFEKQGIDTLRIARKVHKEMESKSLGNLCEYYHIENQAAHRAYHDALATAKIYHMLAHEFEQEFPTLFKPETLKYRPQKVQPCTGKQIEYLKALCQYHNLQVEEDIKKLSRSEMSKKIDAIISNYGMMRLDEKRWDKII